MKKLLIASLVLLVTFHTEAQQINKPQSPVVPAFRILKVDSASYYTNSDLKKHHLTMIMFFSPECEHCQHQTKDIIDEMDKMKNIEIVMATYFPFSEMKEFYAKYHIAQYPNIKMGRDEKYSIPSHFSIRSLPFIALYDKKGKLITTFEGNQKISTLLDAFKKSSD